MTYELELPGIAVGSKRYSSSANRPYHLWGQADTHSMATRRFSLGHEPTQLHTSSNDLKAEYNYSSIARHALTLILLMWRIG
jgi:hypothetical protein